MGAAIWCSFRNNSRHYRPGWTIAHRNCFGTSNSTLGVAEQEFLAVLYTSMLLLRYASIYEPSIYKLRSRLYPAKKSMYHQGDREYNSSKVVEGGDGEGLQSGGEAQDGTHGIQDGTGEEDNYQDEGKMEECKDEEGKGKEDKEDKEEEKDKEDEEGRQRKRHGTLWLIFVNFLSGETCEVSTPPSATREEFISLLRSASGKLGQSVTLYFSDGTLLEPGSLAAQGVEDGAELDAVVKEKADWLHVKRDIAVLNDLGDGDIPDPEFNEDGSLKNWNLSSNRL